MDHGARAEKWAHTGDICYVIAQSKSKTKLSRDTFNRYLQSLKKHKGPSKVIKPSELSRLY